MGQGEYISIYSSYFQYVLENGDTYFRSVAKSVLVF